MCLKTDSTDRRQHQLMDSFLPSFIDIETGYTPTDTLEAASVADFQDLSCMDNLDTPTSFSHMDYFAYVHHPVGSQISLPENMEAFLPTFADIKTGYTPTQTVETPFKDCSRLENLDTPTPLKHTDFFAYLEPTDSVHSSSTSAATTPIQQQPRSQQQTDLLVSTTNIKTEEPACQEAAAAAARPFLIYDQSSVACGAGGSEGRTFAPAAAQYQMPSYCYAQVPQVACFSPRQSYSPQPRQLLETAAGVAHYELSVPIETDTVLTPAGTVPSPAGSQGTAVYTHLQPVRLTVSVEPCALGGGSGPLFEGTAVAHNSRRYSMPQSLYESAAPNQPPQRQTSTTPQFHLFSSPLVCGGQRAGHASAVAASVSRKEASAAPTPMASNLKEKQFLCQIGSCEKRFARVDELKRHQRTHSDYRPYGCDACNKAFTRSDHLITHKRTHTGEKPYPCPHCDRRFARSDERSRHIKTHTNPSRFQQGRGRRIGAGPSRQPQQHRQPPQNKQQQQPKGDPRGEGGVGPSTSY